MAGAGTSGDEFLDGGSGVPSQQRYLVGHWVGRAGLLGQAAAATEQGDHSTVNVLQDPAIFSSVGAGSGSIGAGSSVRSFAW